MPHYDRRAWTPFVVCVFLAAMAMVYAGERFGSRGIGRTGTMLALLSAIGLGIMSYAAWWAQDEASQ